MFLGFKVVILALVLSWSTAKLSFLSQCDKDVTNNSTHDIEKSDPSIQRTTECGGILVADKGVIEYKSSYITRPGLRCVWIIDSGGWAYDVTVKPLLQIGNVANEWLLITDDQMRHYYPDCRTSDNIWTRTIVITYVTVRILTLTTGFRLQYETRKNDFRMEASPHQILNFPVQYFKYPVWGNHYENNEKTLITILPNNNTFSGTDSQFRYRREPKGLSVGAQNCDDKIDMYELKFSTSSSKPYYKGIKSICGDTEYYEIQTSDVILLFFQSDRESRHTGFWLHSA